MIAGLWSKARAALVAFALLAGAVILAFFRGRSAGKSAAKNEAVADQAEETAKVIKTASEVKQDVNKKSSSDVSDDLDKWMRD